MKQFSLEEYLKNPSRKVVTRDGRNVKIHCTDYTDDSLIIAKIEGEDCSHSFYKNGSYIGDKKSPRDLFFAAEKHEGWINIYLNTNRNYEGSSCIYKSKESAEEFGKQCNSYITTVKIEWEE